MMGNKKLSEIRAELRAAFAKEGYNPIPSLERRIRKLQKNANSAAAELRSLILARNALAQVVGEPKKPARPSRAKRPSKAR